MEEVRLCSGSGADRRRAAAVAEWERRYGNYYASVIGTGYSDGTGGDPCNSQRSGAGSVGMFTGLRDINGEDVFENDTVEHVFSTYSPNPRFTVVYSPKEAKFKLRAIGSTEAFVEVQAQDFAEKYRVVK